MGRRQSPLEADKKQKFAVCPMCLKMRKGQGWDFIILLWWLRTRCSDPLISLACFEEIRIRVLKHIGQTKQFSFICLSVEFDFFDVELLIQHLSMSKHVDLIRTLLST